MINALPSEQSVAQITPDHTLGSESSHVSHTRSELDQIDGGARRGRSLFHSFRDFNINEGQQVYFANPAGVENIFSRVTGSSVSNIFGRLGVAGRANLFLLNPNGIMFGPHASLDLRGAFLASTASSILFPGAVKFSAPHPQTPSLLTIDVPIGLQYSRQPPGAIAVQQSALTVDPGQHLSLIGGRVNVQNARLTAPGGQIELDAVNGPGTVHLDPATSTPSLPHNLRRADISIRNGSRLNVTSTTDGAIVIHAQNLAIQSRSQLRAGLNSSTDPSSKAGDITLDATRAIQITGWNSLVNNKIESNAAGDGGNIEISTGVLSVTHRASLSASVFGQGHAGDIVVHASHAVFLDWGHFFSSINTHGSGHGGNIQIFTRVLSATHHSELSTSTFGKGDTGDVDIHARDRVSLDRNSNIFATIEQSGTGNSGDINIFTPNLSLDNGATLITSTDNLGNAGNVNIHAENTVSLAHTASIQAGVERQKVRGQGGDVRISTGNLFLTDGAQLIAGTDGAGNAGNVIVHARHTVAFSGDSQNGNFQSAVFTDVGPHAIGQGGDTVISAENVFLTNGAQLFASTLGRGNSGNVIVHADDTVAFSGSSQDGNSQSGILNNVGKRSSGRSRDIRISADRLLLTNGAQLQARNNGRRNAGNVTIAVPQISLNQGTIDATTALGRGGNITLRNLDLLLLRNNSLISTEAGRRAGASNGGNIRIQSRNGFVVADPMGNSDIVANANGGSGGNVRIAAHVLGLQRQIRQTSEVLRANHTSDISASSRSGPQGLIEVSTPLTDPSRELAELPAAVVDASTQIVQSCPAQGNLRNHFVVTGRGGLPPDPTVALQSSSTILTDWATLAPQAARSDADTPASAHANSSTASTAALSAAQPTAIVEAQGWTRDARGRVTLVTQASTPISMQPVLTAAGCQP